MNRKTRNNGGMPLPPMRRCIGCMTSRPKSEMVRIAVTDDGPVIDRLGRMDGRGIYICPDQACVDAAVKRKALQRVFRRAFDKADTERLFGEIITKC